MQSTCEVCKKVFDHKTGKKRRFCSIMCRRSAKVERLPDMWCKQCGKAIKGERYTGKQFCSRQCFADSLSEERKGVPRPELRGPRPSRQNRVTLICQRCGKEYQVKKSREHRSKFCSKACAGNRYSAQCGQCGKTYQVKAAESERTHFCSRSCYAKWMSNRTGADNPLYNSVEVQCSNCGNLLIRTPSYVKTRKEIFCNSTCYGEWISLNRSGENAHSWLGGTKKWRGASWKRQRVMALNRDNHTCQHCGITQKMLDKTNIQSAKLQVHHIVPFRQFGSDRENEANALTNLVSLCPTCHMKAENELIPIQPYLLSVP